MAVSDNAVAIVSFDEEWAQVIKTEDSYESDDIDGSTIYMFREIPLGTKLNIIEIDDGNQLTDMVEGTFKELVY